VVGAVDAEACEPRMLRSLQICRQRQLSAPGIVSEPVRGLRPVLRIRTAGSRRRPCASTRTSGESKDHYRGASPEFARQSSRFMVLVSLMKAAV
jgi:hypothetical protein